MSKDPVTSVYYQDVVPVVLARTGICEAVSDDPGHPAPRRISLKRFDAHPVSRMRVQSKHVPAVLGLFAVCLVLGCCILWTLPLAGENNGSVVELELRKKGMSVQGQHAVSHSRARRMTVSIKHFFLSRQVLRTCTDSPHAGSWYKNVEALSRAPDACTSSLDQVLLAQYFCLLFNFLVQVEAPFYAFTQVLKVLAPTAKLIANSMLFTAVAQHARSNPHKPGRQAMLAVLDDKQERGNIEAAVENKLSNVHSGDYAVDIREEVPSQYRDLISTLAKGVRVSIPCVYAFFSSPESSASCARCSNVFSSCSLLPLTS